MGFFGFLIVFFWVFGFGFGFWVLLGFWVRVTACNWQYHVFVYSILFSPIDLINWWKLLGILMSVNNLVNSSTNLNASCVKITWKKEQVMQHELVPFCALRKMISQYEIEFFVSLLMDLEYFLRENLDLTRRSYKIFVHQRRYLN